MIIIAIVGFILIGIAPWVAAAILAFHQKDEAVTFTALFGLVVSIGAIIGIVEVWK